MPRCKFFAKTSRYPITKMLIMFIMLYLLVKVSKG